MTTFCRACGRYTWHEKSNDGYFAYQCAKCGNVKDISETPRKDQPVTKPVTLGGLK